MSVFIAHSSRKVLWLWRKGFYFPWSVLRKRNSSSSFHEGKQRIKDKRSKED